ncbi:hypothetical protein D3C77_377580 [compost metagenome]
MTGGAGTSTTDSVVLSGFSTDYARELPAHGNPTDPEHHQGPDRALRVLTHFIRAYLIFLLVAESIREVFNTPGCTITC